jgi:hypothetical protein
MSNAVLPAFSDDEKARCLRRAMRYVKCNNRRRLAYLLRRHPWLRQASTQNGGLLWAALEYNRQMLSFLLEQGLDPNERIYGCGADTLLLSGCAHGDAELVAILLDHGVNLYWMNDEGEHALGYACAWGHIECARLLLEHGFDANYPENHPVQGKNTALDMVDPANEEMVALLHSYGGIRSHGEEQQE